MKYSLLIDLCESHLIPSRTALKKWDETRLTDLCYLYFPALRILVDDVATKEWAERYCKKTIQSNNFDIWRTDGNDFYVLLYALNSDDEFHDARRGISVSTVRDWLHHVNSNEFDNITHRLFSRLDAMFRISSSNLRAIRRTVMHWSQIDRREREDAKVKLIQQIKTLASNSELLVPLKSITRQYSDDDVNESASSGATGAANVATSVGGIGAGFAPDEKWRGIYGDDIIRRVKPPKKPTK